MSFKEVISIPGVFPVLFTLFMASFGFGIVLPILPFYSLSLGAQPYELGMLTATFAFMSLVFSPFLGKLADKYGRKKVILFGTGGFVFSYLIFAFSTSIEMAFIARALEGVFAAGLFPTCISLLSDFTNEAQRGKAMGLMGMSFSLGFILGPAFGGIASAVSVRDAFLLSALFSLANFAMVYFNLKEPHEKPESRDIAKQELSLLHVIKSPILLLFLASFMTTFMIGGLDAVLALYTSEKLGFSSSQVGLLFAYIGVLIMIMQMLTGQLVNKFGEVKLMQAGLLFNSVGFALLALTNDWVSILIPIAIFVIGNAMVFPSVATLLTKKVTGKRGAVMGLDNSFKSLGQIIGPLLGGVLYGFNHIYAFIGLASVGLVYLVLLSFFGVKHLNAKSATG